MIDLITGHQGVAHISAEQVSTINKSMMNGYGSGQIVRLKDGTITDGTLSVIVSTGYWRMDGYDMEIQESDTLLLDPVTTPGDSRIDIIFVELLQDIATGVQRCEYVIIQGEPDPTPSDPATPTEPQNDTDRLILATPLCKCTVHDDDTMDFVDLTIAFDVQAGPRIFLGESSTWDDMSLDERAYYDNCEVIFEDGGPYHIYIYYASSDTLSPIAGDPGPAMAKTPKYATCNTASGTAIKVATTLNNDFVLQTGAVVFVQFDYITATVTDPKLNVDSTGAKFIKAYGTTKPARWWRQGDIVQFVYDGTYWIMYPTSGQINNIDDDITTLNASLTNLFISNSNYNYVNQTIQYNSSYTAPETGIYMFILSGDPATGAASMYFDSERSKNIVSTQAPNTSFFIPLQKGTVLYTRNVSTTTYRLFYYVTN
jgi:hypothetical protein